MSEQIREQLARRTASGAGLLVITRLITRGIDLVALAFLARLLTPADFGLVAIAMTLVLICEAISDLPIAQAVVRLPIINQGCLDTAFTVSAIRGMGIATLLCLSAWPFAIVYRDPRLIGLLCALSLAPAFRGVCNPRFAIFARNLDFRREMLVEVFAKLAALLVSVGIARTTHSYWAIAAGTIIGPVTMNVVAYLMAPWRPRFTLQQWPVFRNFLSWASAGQMLNAVSWQVDQLALGRFVVPGELGLFTIASTLAFLPFQVVINQIARPIIAGFALLQTDPHRLAAAYRLGSATLVTLCLPVMVGMSVLAHPIAALTLGPKWDMAANVLQWLALATVPALFVATVGPLAMAVDRTDLGFRLSFAEFVVRLPLTCIAAAAAGIEGVLAARAAATLAMTIYALALVRVMLGLSISSQILSCWRPIISSIVMGLAIRQLWATTTHGSLPLQLAIELLGAMLVGALAYGLATLSLWHVSGRPTGPEARALQFVALIRSSIAAAGRRRAW
ncbi:lipopolysaccharide biosynthesis protein [Sphingomonas sp. BIUV-7]|uniref:Lipopolysaccharide biosynthesis protein n=1 Tax=Sphingomonas natans TaxID=3063330 RepID=A0ABT8YCT8_9SPHN|nr:lipopolysaccharide biosynthesis protein [Sphingomonas sp. BIUV-7]MDO6416180.1 lipopolysaccharide biosynthesis protein [Sphingomonas sp. BIUV-7]